MIYRNGYIWYVEITDIYTTYGIFFFYLFIFLFVWHEYFNFHLFYMNISLSQNDSMNIKYEEIIYIYSDRTNILVLETLYLS